MPEPNTSRSVPLPCASTISSKASGRSTVGELGYDGGRLVINNGEIGPLAQRLYDGITAIQYGRTPDTHGWITVCR